MPRSTPIRPITPRLALAESIARELSNLDVTVAQSMPEAARHIRRLARAGFEIVAIKSVRGKSVKAVR